MKEFFCYNCGKQSLHKLTHPIDNDLQVTWTISDKLVSLFDRREGTICQNCGVNVRAQGLARAILDSKYGFNANSLTEWVNKANLNKLVVCELNSCHELHPTLSKLDNLIYAEYGTESEQDIENLSYKDCSFDLVLHSETLEHVNDPSKAMDECRRILRKSGLILFTVPVIWSRKTRRHAKIKNGKRIDLLSPSYHGKKAEDYMVFYEYGYDVDSLLRSRICYTDPKNQNYVFYSPKEPINIPNFIKIKLILNQKLAEIKEVSI